MIACSASGMSQTRFSAQGFDHASHHEGLRDGLLEADRQGSILIGAARERFLDENMARNGGHRREHRLVAYAFTPQARDHAVARALRGHPDSTGFREHYFAASHVLIAGICC